MSIPLSTTTITITRPSSTPPEGETYADPYDTPGAPSTVVRGVRAHISSPRGSEQVAGGSQEVVTFRLDCDPVDLRHTDRVLDDMTGAVYDVVWARNRVGFGMEHVEADLRQVTGVG